MTEGDFSRVICHRVAPGLAVLILNIRAKFPSKETMYTIGRVDARLVYPASVNVPAQTLDTHCLVQVSEDGSIVMDNEQGAQSSISWYRACIPLVLA